MIQRTYEQCVKAVPAEKVWVATDSQKIADHCTRYNMNVIMTSDQCLTGTDRVAEVAQQKEADCYINVQGDEPLFNPEDILKTLAMVSKYPGEIINGYAPIDREEDYRSASVPKVVLRPDGRLLYMSRSAIPGNKTKKFNLSWRQICVYAFPKKALVEFASSSSKTPLEAQEDIEILRFLELGYEVRMVELSGDSIAVDMPEDADRVRAVLRDSK